MALSTNTDPLAAQQLVNTTNIANTTTLQGQALRNAVSGNWQTMTVGTNQWSNGNLAGYAQSTPTPNKCAYEKCPGVVDTLSFPYNGKTLHLECVVETKLDERIDKLLHEKSGLARWLEEHRK